MRVIFQPSYSATKLIPYRKKMFSVFRSKLSKVSFLMYESVGMFKVVSEEILRSQMSAKSRVWVYILSSSITME